MNFVVAFVMPINKQKKGWYIGMLKEVVKSVFAGVMATLMCCFPTDIQKVDAIVIEYGNVLSLECRCDGKYNGNVYQIDNTTDLNVSVGDEIVISFDTRDTVDVTDDVILSIERVQDK